MSLQYLEKFSNVDTISSSLLKIHSFYDSREMPRSPDISQLLTNAVHMTTLIQRLRQYHPIHK